MTNGLDKVMERKLNEAQAVVNAIEDTPRNALKMKRAKDVTYSWKCQARAAGLTATQNPQTNVWTVTG